MAQAKALGSIDRPVFAYENGSFSSFPPPTANSSASLPIFFRFLRSKLRPGLSTPVSDPRDMVISSSNPHSKEISIRRRIGSIFNKREDDFESLKEYNDYLEEVEDMTFNLIEGIDVQDIEAKIAKYQEENAEQIMINRARKAEELAAALAASKGRPAVLDADESINQGGGGPIAQGQYAPTFVGGQQPRPTGMAPQPVPVGSGLDFDMQGYDNEEMIKLRAERGGRAGGWSVEFSRRRAFEEAFGSLWIL